MRSELPPGWHWEVRVDVAHARLILIAPDGSGAAYYADQGSVRNEVLLMLAQAADAATGSDP
jgi:hypothetical protein